MYGALMITLRYATKSAVIIGTDCSGLTVEDLQDTSPPYLPTLM
jgi:hypothetical protein